MMLLLFFMVWWFSWSWTVIIAQFADRRNGSNGSKGAGQDRRVTGGLFNVLDYLGEHE